MPRRRGARGLLGGGAWRNRSEELSATWRGVSRARPRLPLGDELRCGCGRPMHYESVTARLQGPSRGRRRRFALLLQ